MQKLEGKFKIKSEWAPAGDQPKAIEKLVKGLKKGMNKQILLGVTGSGKTFTIANVIQQVQKPTLVIAHNKTLAAQLAQEFKEFFPHNKVHYFVSYYDYYQPEAYVSATDTYIEKDASINEEIDRLRHASTQSILTRNDTIIVASVSCIYGLGSPKEYFETNLLLKVDDQYNKFSVMEALVKVHYQRTNADLKSGMFRAVGNRVDVNPMSETWMASIFFENNRISKIQILDPISMVLKEEVEEIMFFPAKHFITDEKSMSLALTKIQKELDDQIKFFQSKPDKLIEAERIMRRTQQDIAMMREFGYCSGIENYSRHLAGKAKGEPPETLLSYFPKDEKGNPDFLLVVDESHVTLPQLHGMYAGDQARKKNLVDYGFRLPSAMDNRPLQFKEFEERVGQQIYVSATPSEYEREASEQIVEQIIRPTGLIDPEIVVKPVLPKDKFKGQVEDFIEETVKEVKKCGRVLVTTLTKKMAEDLATYLRDRKVKAEYIHSDVKTMDRIQILTKFRKGDFDCLVGVNLLREGLDLPEVSLN
jgi:excinuclease ABC subunit B